MLACRSDKLRDVQLLRGVWTTQTEYGPSPTSGTYFPVNPASSQCSSWLFASAGRCVYDSLQRCWKASFFRRTFMPIQTMKVSPTSLAYDAPEPVDLGWLKEDLMPEDLREFAPSDRRISITLTGVQPGLDGFLSLGWCTRRVLLHSMCTCAYQAACCCDGVCC